MPKRIAQTARLALLLAATVLAGQVSLAADLKDSAVVPEVARRDIKLPKFPSTDFEVGVFGGIYSAQNFGSSPAGGLRIGYHITEDFFVEGAAGQTTVSDEAFRRILPGGIFSGNTEQLVYTHLNLGVNLLPGEVFLGTRYAMPSQVYLLVGGGTTRFNDQRMQTAGLGVGVKVYLADAWALRFDLRDNVYKLDLLGKADLTHNVEFNFGASFLF